MKKIISATLIIFAVSCTSVQDPVVTKDSGATPESLAMQYYLVKKKSGELYIHQYDKIIPIKEKTIIMDDGVIVTPSGKIYLADGRKFQMKQGKKMYLSGNKAGQTEIIANK
ncbi:MAG TPA: DUF6799 domain-containing protein [Cytophagaceae bacterium]|jgi:hypothetical protein|nr:DUF6799 domain-containing protein [Cytophagaceae bacterium]